MEKVFILEGEWESGDGYQHRIFGLYANKERAREEMRRLFVEDKHDYVFSQYFDENGELLHRNGVDVEVSDDNIKLYDDLSPYFIEYNITEHPISYIWEEK